MTLSVRVDLLPDDLALMAYIRDFIKHRARAPKRWEVVGHQSRFNSEHRKRDQRTFERLKLLGLVIHSSNGHCWLSDQAKELPL